MLNIDAKGILTNTGRTTLIFPGIRPTTIIREDYWASCILNFDDPISLGESVPASVTFVSPKYYANSL